MTSTAILPKTEIATARVLCSRVGPHCNACTYFKSLGWRNPLVLRVGLGEQGGIAETASVDQNVVDFLFSQGHMPFSRSSAIINSHFDD
jgi:hypothetical protein